MMRLLLIGFVAATSSCGGGGGDSIVFPEPGPIGGAAGEGSFTIGVSTAAAQIEESVPELDWYLFTKPAPDGVGAGTEFVGEAIRGYSRAMEDIMLIEDMNLDAYRVNPNWSRIEPTRDAIDDAELEFYDGVIDALVAGGIKPNITLHHFSSPRWVDDTLRREKCPAGAKALSDEDLCGWAHVAGAEEIIAEIAEYAGLLAAEYGDRVDEWGTLNEPVNYFIAAYGADFFPPGRANILGLTTDGGVTQLMRALERYIRAHIAMYDAIKANDTIDADGDGEAALVGFALNVVDWVPARNGALSDNADDVAAAEAMRYIYNELFADSVINGTFDIDINREIDPSEERPEWEGKIDWLGVQYYFRAGVTADAAIQIGLVGGLPCFSGVVIPGIQPCLDIEDATKCIPTMQYAYHEAGVYDILSEYAELWPNMPLTVTESGVATTVGRRRAEHITRSLEQIWQAREEGADIRGYYHWSLTDNFEWAEGFEPRFGLYTVDIEGTYDRTATGGATTITEIAELRELTSTMRGELGGTGPMTPESEDAPPVNENCQKIE